MLTFLARLNRLRSIGVVHYFKDSEVLDEDFLKKHLIPCMEAAAPFVQYLNEVSRFFEAV